MNGTDYLAAYPLFPPVLLDVLEQTVSTDPAYDPAYDPRNGAFDITACASSGSTDVDPFVQISYELRMMILSQLPSRDIAALRLASRAFRQLPISFFYDLLMREMPWLWELWDSTAYAPWACTTATELQTKLEKCKYSRQAVVDYMKIVKEELSELTNTMDETLAAFDLEDQKSPAIAESKKPICLPRARSTGIPS